MERDHYIDIAKGFAMVLVIIGHTACVPYYMKYWLYSFHMPLFFLLSGLNFDPDRYPTLKAFLLRKLQTLVLPYFTCSLLVWLWIFVVKTPGAFLGAGEYCGFFGNFIM